MSVRFKCPACSKRIEVAMAHAGQRGKCPGCGKMLKMPNSEQLQRLKDQQAKRGAAAGSLPPQPAAPATASGSEENLFSGVGPLGGSTAFGGDDFGLADEIPTARQESINPYAAPLASDGRPMPTTAAETADVEATRRRLLKHEASIKSMGLLFLVGAVLLGIAGFWNTYLGLTAIGSSNVEPGLSFVLIGIGIVCLAIGGFQFWVGLGLRKFNPVIRIPAIILSVIGLLGFPIGTLINAYFIYLVASTKGHEVLSHEYQRVVAATPHIKYRSIVLSIFLGVLVVFAVVVILALLLGDG